MAISIGIGISISIDISISISTSILEILVLESPFIFLCNSLLSLLLNMAWKAMYIGYI